jgi:hypothetical protein
MLWCRAFREQAVEEATYDTSSEAPVASRAAAAGAGGAVGARARAAAAGGVLDADSARGDERQVSEARVLKHSPQVLFRLAAHVRPARASARISPKGARERER